MSHRIRTIEVFKTDVLNKFQSRQIKSEILKKHPQVKISFDLEDVDRVLRVEGSFDPNDIICILVRNKHKCEILT